MTENGAAEHQQRQEQRDAAKRRELLLEQRAGISRVLARRGYHPSDMELDEIVRELSTVSDRRKTMQGWLDTKQIVMHDVQDTVIEPIYRAMTHDYLASILQDWSAIYVIPSQQKFVEDPRVVAYGGQPSEKLFAQVMFSLMAVKGVSS